jgi:uncharacterized membrane protein YbjE (DUF340 family)
MGGLLQIFVLLAFLAGGAILARLSLVPKSSIVDITIRYVLWVLLLGMGFRIGNSPELYANIGSLGALACMTAILSVLGSCAALVVASLFIPGLKRKPENIKAAFPSVQKNNLADFMRHLKAPLSLLAFVAAGLVLGALAPPLGIDMGAITGWTLNILLLLIGMQFVQSGTSLKKVLMSPSALAVPFATIIGTLTASLLLVPIFSISAGKALALAGGFGWYSLSGVLISNLGDPVLGSVAFLANMFRESLALLLIPFLGRTTIPALAVSVGGATAMDVTLPLIEQSAGAWIVPVSFMSGAILSLTVPFIVPFFFSLG